MNLNKLLLGKTSYYEKFFLIDINQLKPLLMEKCELVKCFSINDFRRSKKYIGKIENNSIRMKYKDNQLFTPYFDGEFFHENNNFGIRGEFKISILARLLLIIWFIPVITLNILYFVNSSFIEKEEVYLLIFLIIGFILLINYRNSAIIQIDEFKKDLDDIPNW